MADCLVAGWRIVPEKFVEHEALTGQNQSVLAFANRRMGNG